MKKLYSSLLLVTLLFVSSCERNFDIKDSYSLESLEELQNKYLINKTIETGSWQSEDPFLITPEMAETFVSLRFQDNPVRNATVLTGDGFFLYLYNFEEGWALISSDTRAQPVLAFEREGEMTADLLQSVPLDGWYELICEEQRALKKYDPDIDNEYTSFWKKFITNIEYYLPEDNDPAQTKGPIEEEEHYVWGKLLVSRDLWSSDTVSNIGHLIETKWGQMHPWNVSMPVIEGTSTNLMTGCVAVALSQLMYYHHFKNNQPDFIYPDIEIDSTLYHYEYNPSFYATITVNRGQASLSSGSWNLMAKDSTCTGDSLRFKHVSDLMLDFGDLVDMYYFYSNNEPTLSGVLTGLTYSKVTSALSSYNFHYSGSTYSLSTTFSELMAQRPVFIYNTYSSQNQDRYHAWLIDGYDEYSLCYLLTYVWTKIYDQTLWEECYVIDTEPTSVHQEGDNDFEYEYVTERYLKMNWGYDGLYDDVLVTIGSSGNWTAYNYTSRWCNLIHSIYPQN